MNEKVIVNNSELKDGYVYNCSFIKLVLLLLVVLQHSMQFWNGQWFTAFNPKQDGVIGLQLFSQWLYNFHIYGFVFISGYLFFYLKYEKGKYCDFRIFIYKKFMRLIVPAVAFTWLWVMPITHFFYHFDIKKIIIKYVIADAPGQLWFLFMLFNVFMLFWVCSKWIYRHTVLAAVFVVSLYIVGTIAKVYLYDAFQIWTGLQYITFFFIGFKVRQYGSKVLMRFPSCIYVFVDVVLFLALFYMPNNSLFYIIARIVLQYLLNIVGSIMSFVVLQKVALKYRWERDKIVKKLVSISMPIYLIHQQIIYFVIMLFNGRVNPYIHSVINFTIALLFSGMFGLIMIRFKPTRILIGEK